MKGWISYRREVTIVDNFEVIVAGGGPAGIAAAVASARNGARTLLIERYGFLGGNATASLVGPFMTSYSLDGRHQLIRGIFEELVLRMEGIGGAIHPSKVPAGSPYSGFIVFGHDKVTPFDPEAVKFVAEEMCLEAGVELLYHSFIVDVMMEGDAVVGVVVANKAGLEAFQAHVVVDCTADADVAARAGVPFEVGRAQDGLTQPMTLFFRIAGVDDERVAEYIVSHPEDRRPFASVVREARERGEFLIPREGIGMYKTLEKGVWRINTTRIQGVFGTDPRDLTRAEIEGRRQILFLLQFFREKLPGLENCRLLDTATQVGVRETRRILGEYTLTADDITQGREFDDVIALAGYPFDIHSPTGSGGGATGELTSANVYEIPYRCLVPVNRNGLLVAGRCVSATHEALGAIRVMPTAFALGQAAGTAAALAVHLELPPRRVPIETLQRTLLEQGVYLGERIAQKLQLASEG
ncbi:MAG: FAD-dependent oxidoreductase [Chloroflexota bacterium]